MAKRANQDIKNKTSRSHKTKKRLAIKHARLALKRKPQPQAKKVRKSK
ncbi:MAG: hypothetical protein WCG60_00980 [bacterium]|jgi:hypothetical protein